MITVPTTAPETVRMPPTTSIASTSTAASSVYWRGFVLPIVWTRSAPARPITAMLTVQAVSRAPNMPMPSDGAAISSSRVATAKRPARVSPNQWATNIARAAASHSQMVPRRMGTPESPPAPLVSSCQFFTTWSTTNRTASVIIAAARPPVLATATPTTAPNASATSTPTSVAGSAPRWTSPNPNGRSGSCCALVATGIAQIATAYAAIWANARCPNDRMPVLPMNTWRPSTNIRLTSNSLTSSSLAEPPVDVYTTPATNKAIDRIAVAAAERPTRNNHGSLIRAPRSSTLNNPDGRTMNSSATSPNTNASVRRCGVPSGRYERRKTSARPSANPPTTAPVKLPRPPMIAATTAFSSQSAPSVGSAVGLRIRIRTAATPARNPAYAKAPEITRFARTPISRAASKSSAAPRTAMPNNVRLNTIAVSASTATVTATVTRSMISNRTPPSSKVSNAQLGPGNVFFLGDTRTCHSACDKRSIANDVSSIVNGLELRTQRNATRSMVTEARMADTTIAARAPTS